MKNIFYLLLIVLFPLNVLAQSFQNLSVKDGLSQSSVMCIYQDTLGRMWFGTREGVNRYDGKQIKSLRPQTVLERNDEHFVAGKEVKNITGGKNGDVFLLVSNVLFKYNILNDRFSKVYSKHVTALGNTLDKNIWFTVKDSLFLYDVDKEKSKFVRELGVVRPSVIYQVNRSVIYIGGVDGLFEYNLDSDRISAVIPNIDVYSILMSSRNELWVSSRMDGLYSIKSDGTVVKAPISPSHVVSNQVRQLVEDDDHNIWFGTFDGLQVYNPYSGTYRVHRSLHRLGGLSHSSVFSLYKDSQGTIWVGTYYGGVNYFNPQNSVYNNYMCNELRDDCLNFPLVGDMVEDNDGNIWMATDGGGVNCLNRKTQKFTYYTAGVNGLLHNNVKTISYDRKNEQIYIGTHTGGLSRLDRLTGKVHNYLKDAGVKGPNDIIFHTEMFEGDLYVSARNGFWKLSSATGKFELLDDSYYYINFEVDRQGYAWLNTGQNLFVMNLRNIKDFHPWKFNDLFFEHENVTRVVQSSDGIIYITTSGNGLYSYDKTTDELEHFTREDDNLLSNYCYNVIETSNNNILISTDKGLSIYSPFAKWFYSVEMRGKEGLSAMAEGCGVLVASDELIYVGGLDGMISFRENDLLSNLDDIPNNKIYFSRLQINNIDIIAGDATGVLKQSLPFTEELVLTANQNNIIVDFSNSNYVNSLRNTWYQYCLEGFDKKWISTTEHSLHYTNLPSGNYVLKVREIGNWVNMSDLKEIALPIVILTPWYRTTLMYILYFFVVTGGVYMVWHVKMSRKLFEISLENERKEKERIEELNRFKLRFFTNISHEFRTPLTLIIGQLEVLREDRDLSLAVKRRLSRIYRNTIHMRNLITELLDFRKQDQGYLKLNVREYNMVEFLQDLYYDFKDYAALRNIKYEFIYPYNEPVLVWFDAVQMQKAVFNLLSNAFKYTKAKGVIVLRLELEDNSIVIKIEDNGCGISTEDLKNIFDRFYQVDSGKSQVSTGTGIGLALTKSIVNLHKGTIDVESEIGKGSVFQIRLLLGNAHFDEEQLAHSEVEVDLRNGIEDKILEARLDAEAMKEKDVIQNDNAQESEIDGKGKCQMLIVEDDADIIEMLEEVFSPIYHVFKANNGEEGFRLACDIQPDIIVSDVKMPIMSGVEMCHKIKNCIEISHIPVVLLTAHTAVEQTVEGYAYGADDYIAKPFNVKVLVARCNNLVNSRKALINRLRDKGGDIVTKDNNSSLMALNASDQKFLDQVTHIVKANFDNPNFNMDMIASELGMGRSKLYSRFKEITNLTPNEFTLRMKLEEGKNLLVNAPDLNVSEISYKLGFSSLKYFSKCFKSFYGVTPLAYRKSMNGANKLVDE